MPLPSQSARPVSRRSNMFRRKRRRSALKMIVVVGAIAGAAYGGWRVYDSGVFDQSNTLDDPERQLTLSDQVRRSNNNDQSNSDTVISEPGGAESPASTLFNTESSIDRSSEATADIRQASHTPVTPPQQPEPDPAPASTTTSTTSTTDDAWKGRPTNEAHRATPDTERPPSSARRRTLATLEAGHEAIRRNEPLDARRQLSAALASGHLTTNEAAATRQTLRDLNQRLLFSPEFVDDDPFTFMYVIQSGDSLERICRRLSLQCDWRMLQRINQINKPSMIRAGHSLKVATGPFHAIVDKSDFRMDIWMGEGTDIVYVTSFEVGLGEYNSTPLGLFRVRRNSKLINPAWANPRTGERFEPDDPKNPIGEYWIGLEGLEESNAQMGGYGIHGTIDLDSIGTQASMGCVRMRPDDIALVYELLVHGPSTVRIVK